MIVVCAMRFLPTSSAIAQKDTLNTAPLLGKLAPDSIEALRAFKQLGFDDQHVSGRLRQSDIAVHHVYHDPNQARGKYKPYLSSNYGTSSSRGHISSSFESSPYLSGQQVNPGGAVGKSSLWPDSANNEMSNVGYQHQLRSHPNDILSNMGVELSSEQILGKRTSFVQ